MTCDKVVFEFETGVWIKQQSTLVLDTLSPKQIYKGMVSTALLQQQYQSQSKAPIHTTPGEEFHVLLQVVPQSGDVARALSCSFELLYGV